MKSACDGLWTSNGTLPAWYAQSAKFPWTRVALGSSRIERSIARRISAGERPIHRAGILVDYSV